jgi:4a-hydroxytetrahydrobiopterin dehydratase
MTAPRQRGASSRAVEPGSVPRRAFGLHELCRYRAETLPVRRYPPVMSALRDAPITPESLARERCAEIRAGTPPLTAEEAGLLAAGVAGEWQIGEGEIRREFTFKTFNAAFGLATRIALLAEAQGHHPVLEVGWGRLVVRLSTHSVGGLSRNDFIMAARIDRLAGG